MPKVKIFSLAIMMWSLSGPAIAQTMPALPPGFSIYNRGAPEFKETVLYFGRENADISATAGVVLDMFVGQVSGKTIHAVFLTGHADTMGTHAEQMIRSQGYANAIAAALRARGAPPATITISARGAAELFKKTAANISEPLNRRVHIRLEYYE